MKFEARKVYRCLPRYWREEVVSYEPGWRSNVAIAWRGDGAPKHVRFGGSVPPGWLKTQTNHDRCAASIVGDAFTSADERACVVEGDWGAVVVYAHYRPLLEACASLYLVDTDDGNAMMVMGSDKAGEASLFVMPFRPGADQ